jgi:hypothetical protein
VTKGVDSLVVVLVLAPVLVAGLKAEAGVSSWVAALVLLPMVEVAFAADSPLMLVDVLASLVAVAVECVRVDLGLLQMLLILWLEMGWQLVLMGALRRFGSPVSSSELSYIPAFGRP